jgi:hypothetical protein
MYPAPGSVAVRVKPPSAPVVAVAIGPEPGHPANRSAMTCPGIGWPVPCAWRVPVMVACRPG